MAGIALKRTRQVPAEETPAFAGIAERFRRAGDLNRAIALCHEGLQRFPALLSARVTLGWALLDTGKFDEARTELEQVLRRAPDNLAAIRGLAELHDRADGAVSAMESWQAQQETVGQVSASTAPPEVIRPVAQDTLHGELAQLAAALSTTRPASAPVPVLEPEAPGPVEVMTVVSAPVAVSETAIELESPAAVAVEAAWPAAGGAHVNAPVVEPVPVDLPEVTGASEAAHEASLTVAHDLSSPVLDEWTDAAVAEALDRAADAASAASSAAEVETTTPVEVQGPRPVEADRAAEIAQSLDVDPFGEDESDFTFAVTSGGPRAMPDAAVRAPEPVAEPAVAVAQAATEIVAQPAAEPVAAPVSEVVEAPVPEPTAVPVAALEANEDLNDVIQALAAEEIELESRVQLELPPVHAVATGDAPPVPSFEMLAEEEDPALLAELEALVAAEVAQASAELESNTSVVAHPALETAVPVAITVPPPPLPALASLPLPVAEIAAPVRTISAEVAARATRKQTQIEGLERFLQKVQHRRVQLLTQSVA